MIFFHAFVKKIVKSILDLANHFLFSLYSKTKFQKQGIQKILLVNFQGVGDIVMTTPLLSTLRTEYPHAQIDYLCAKENGIILSSDSRVNHVFSRKKDDLFSFDFIQTVSHVRSLHYDLVLNLFPASHSALLALLSRAIYIAGPLYSQSSVCTWSSQQMKSTWDIRVQCQNIASLLGISLENPYILSLAVDSKQKKNVLKKLNMKKKYIVFNTPAQWIAKQWPVASWQELIRLLLAEKKYKDYQLAFLGTASDTDLITSILSPFGENSRLENWSGKWSLAELPLILQYASLIISTDSGPMHIASAVQTKTIGLFGVTDPSILVNGNKYIEIVSSFDSCPKHLQFNHHNEPKDLEQIQMKKIPVQEVLNKIEEKIELLKILKHS